MDIHKTIGILFCLILAISCDKNATVQNDGKIVAAIGEFKLYDSDVHQQMSYKTGDSLLLANSITEDWLRKKALYIEAQKKTSEENVAEINSLVEDYRQSLYIHHYEQQMISEFFDQDITNEEIEAYFNQHKEDYTLNEAIIQVHLAKIPEKVAGLDQFWMDWKKERIDKVKTFVDQHAELASMDENLWQNMSDVLILLPPSKFKSSNFQSDKTYQENFEGHEYFIRTFGLIKKGETSPIEFVTDRITKVIRHQKEKVFLSKLKEKHYQDILDKKEIKLYQD